MNPSVLLTLVLVVVTAYYAFQSYQMVREMRATRLASIAPRLVPVVEYDRVPRGFVSVENIGPGPALDINIVLTFEPNDTAFRLHRGLLRTGDKRLWNPANTGEQEAIPQVYQPDAYLPHHTHVRLTGTCRDLLGRVHTTDERTPVLNRWEMRFRDHWIVAESGIPVEVPQQPPPTKPTEGS